MTNLKNNGLETFVTDYNTLARIFGYKQVAWPLSGADLLVLKDQISMEMSPENLTCDGELTDEEVGRKLDYMNQVKKEVDELLVKV